MTNTPKTHYLKDYKKPNFELDKVYLTFEIDDHKTIVTCETKLKKVDNGPLVLDGERIKLKEILIDNKALSESDYTLSDTHLTIEKTPDEFDLKIVNEIDPKNNTYLDGLYKSKGIFCTQNESQGFRKISYFLDRPDVMTTYTTKIIADKKLCPVLLSNGNKIESGDLSDGKHFVVWEDPFKKPCYLFALVAGDLEYIEDTFTRRSGKDVKLQIFCEKGLSSKCLFSMESLKKSMVWDEEVFNLEYDLDIFMIVAVDAFNAGAMENKGLNIFNTSCILADPKTATDDNFIRVEKVVAHEYFHNWTGDRVTLRDWFQLTLKEGLTVFRDQEFTSDTHSRAVHRIENVQILRGHQFLEDAGPTSHPIRPPSYIEMNNFYTSTVYDKGSEIIRMIYTLIGKEAFFLGMKKYFELFDGMAVTCEDFVHAMELGSSKDLTQFKRWYEQKGTPQVNVKTEYSEKDQKFTLHLEQSNPKEGENSPPLHFPLKVGLIDDNGKEFEVPKLIEMNQKMQSFTFDNISSKPTLSFNREFSAPIISHTPLKLEDYAKLMAYDSDDFNRYEASQEIATKVLLDDLKTFKSNQQLQLNTQYNQAYKLLLENDSLDPALKTMALHLPTESTLGQKQKVIDIDGNYFVISSLKKALAQEHEEAFLKIYKKLNVSKEYQLTPKDVGERKLKNICLSYLTSLEKNKYFKLCYEQFKQANNMSDQFAALAILSCYDCKERVLALDEFYQEFKDDQLVIIKWLSLQALSPIKSTLSTVKELTNHPIYDPKIPNLVRGLIAFFLQNHIHFHAIDGSGYDFILEQISMLDEINPQNTARLCGAFKCFPKLDLERQNLMRGMLESLLNKKGLSKNTYEIVSLTLKSAPKTEESTTS